MRLDDFDPNAIDVEDQRGSGGGFSVGRGGQVGCGTLVIALIAAVVFGVDPTQMLGGLSQPGQVQQLPDQSAQGATGAAESCSVDAASRESCNALSSLNKTWGPLFQQAQLQFKRPKLVFYSQQGSSGCGSAQSAMGPFYCPNDHKVYIDLAFYEQLKNQFHAPGEFAQAYVVAHEVGHHVQTLLGISDKVMQLRENMNERQSNALQVRMELQADCFAGVWANLNEKIKPRLEPGEVEQALNAASQIGDDTLQKRMTGRVVPDAFTHGTSAQRVRWFKQGLSSGQIQSCDTFNAPDLG